jgi:hypothetical protein
MTQPKWDKSMGQASSGTEDRRVSDPAQVTPMDKKVCALKQYRHSKGFCDKCAENGPMDISV